MRKMSPSGHEYLTGSVACGDRDLDAGESLADYYTAHGYPPGQWFGRGAAELGVDGEVTAAQMQALFGEGRHPNSDRLEADLIAAGASPKEALEATKLGRRFPRHSEIDDLRTRVSDAYKAHNLEHDRPIGAPIDEATRARIRHDVQARAYADAHDGTRPTDTELKEWLAQQKKRMKNATSGYELVFAPPKSVSVAWALSDEATREQIVELHRQAVRDTLQYFEDNVAHTRKGAGGYAQYDARGITAACFEHWDSRAGDPHLHTHVPISTKVQGPDGTWTSLDGRTVLAAAVTTSEYYNSRLRDLFREHGASWRLKPTGGIDLKRPVWELDGIPNELLAGFSRRASAVEQERARAIVEFRDTHGREPSPKDILEIGRRAQYGTRDAKQAPRTLAEHVRRWRAQAREILDPDTLAGLGQRGFGGEPEALAEVDVADLAARTLATVSDHHSHFNIWNIEAEAHRQSAHLRVPDNTRDTLIAQIVEAVLLDSDTVGLQAPSLVDEPAELRRANGESVFTEHNAQRFTTHRTLREEAALAAWGRRRDGTRISTSAVEKALRGTKLNDGQAKAVRAFATSGRRVQLLYAPAGTGKTTTMRAFAEAWRAEAGTVYAFGPSARAAQELGNSIGAEPHTLHQVTTAQKFGFAQFAFPFARGDVLIVDEAAMAGTHTLHAVVRYALDRGADVRLVGDDRQLTAVEAGGAVRWFAHRNGALRLNEVVRFADPDQSKASLLLHDANPAGLDYYFEQNWVQAGSRETMRDAAHHAWRNDLDAGCPSLLIVPANDDVTALNHQARQLRLRRGDVDHAGRSVALHDGTHASTGDLVVTRSNDRLTTLFRGKDFVKNGDTWTVKAVTRSGGLTLRHHTHKATVTLPAHYVAEHVELAYATTVNRAQGMSINGNAHSLVTRGLSREQLYTQMTRAIHHNYSYVETLQHTIDSHQETPPESTALGVMKAALERSSAETSATEELRGSLEKAESLRTLIGHHDFVAHLHTDTRIESVLTDHAPHLLDHPAAPALRQTVRTAEDLGWQPEHLILAALNQGPLTDTDDPAGVLQWRIAQRLMHDTPPPRLGAPTQHQLTHWRALVQHHKPTADVNEPAWDRVWKLAAAGVDEGLDGDAAVATAARQLAQRPGHDPMEAHRYSADTVTAALAEQRAHGHGWNPVLPWLARPETRVLSEDMNDYLERLDAAIHARHTELRAQVSADPPAWTASLGPRPESPEAAERWDSIAGLAAAYRDTYNITSNDPAHPLGPRPQGNGLRARAYADLLEQWRPADHTHEQADAVEQLRTDIDTDELLRTFAEPLHQTATEPLSVLVAQHRDLSRQLIDHVSRQALSEHAPNALGQPAEPALLATLRRAEAQGWQPDRLIARAATTRGRDHTDDLAAVLRWRIESHIADHQPPARTTEPTPDQLDRWRDIVTRYTPNTEITDDWKLVWRHAAAGAATGLNVDTAVANAARKLANRPANDPMDAHRHTAQTLVNHLAHQSQHRADNSGLPWLDCPHRTLHTTNPALGDRLDELTTTIHTRLTEIRDDVATDPPAWASSLGPRPQEPAAAESWDNVVGLAAAYRETYRIHTTNPDVPLGPEPSGPTAKATAWRDITDKWSTIMTNPNQHFQRDDALERLEALRDQILETHQDHHDEHTEQHLDYRDDAIRRASEHDHDDRYGYDDEHGLDHGSGSHQGL
ncbi:relaxase domain-containing protein [Saccharopolyspora endophytica]|uniref:Relaxase domain-containing protein n=2 Tax=Saccharopolyspora endophytica TaxID=543886 RepID=A0ABS5DQU5_9PSEU|nr:relaxase domain-containing protein [Saccharopolyspora endophytica]